MAPAAHTSQTPSSADVNNGAAITTGVRFTVDEELDCAGIAFYVPGTNSGTYTVGLYQTTSDDDPNGSGTGTELATDSVGSGSVTGGTWAEVLFDTPVTLSTGVVYTAARHSSSGRYVSSSGAFTSASISGNGVTLLQDGTDPNPPGLGSMRNGVFHEGASLAYPNSTFGAADYFVDIVLDDGGPIEIPVGTATETDTALAIGRQKRRTVGVTAETDTALTIGRSKRRTVTTVTSTEVALPLGRSKRRTLGVATETNTAVAVGRTKIRAVGLATETDQALPITVPGSNIVHRPFTGTTTRPSTGTVTRPFTGIVSRP